MHLDSFPALPAIDNYLSIVLLAANANWTIALIVLLLFLLILSYFISGGFVAIFSLTTKDVNVLKTKQHAQAKRIINLLEEPKEAYTTLLISSIVVNICFILTAAFLMNQFVPAGTVKIFNSAGWDLIIELVLRVLIIAFVLVFGGEILPKVYATQNNLRFAYSASFVLEMLHFLFRRISKRMVAFAERIGRRLGANRSQVTSLRELDAAMDISTNEQTSQEEKIF